MGSPSKFHDDPGNLQVAAGRLFTGNYFLPTGHLLPIIAGSIAAHVFAYSKNGRLDGIARNPIGAALVLLILVVIICGYRPVGLTVSAIYSLVVAAGAGLLILHACCDGESLVRRLLSTPVALWLGRRSYGLYLYHRTITILIPALIPGITLRYAGPLDLLVAFIVAELSYRFVERPIQRAGRDRLKHRRQAAPQPIRA